MQKLPMPQSKYKKETQSPHLWSVSKTTEKQTETQPEVTRNCQDSASKHCYPSRRTNLCPDVVKSQSNHMQPVKAELKKSQVNTMSQVQTSKYKRDTNTQA